jgi:hypothetical protein
VLTCLISLVFDRSCLFLLVPLRLPAMKLISRLADWNAPLGLPPLGGSGGNRSLRLLSQQLWSS